MIALQPHRRRELGTMLDTPSRIGTVPTQPLNSSEQSILTAAKGSGIMFFGALFEIAGRFALGILFARFMGVQQYGMYNLADSATGMLMGLSVLGLDTALVYFVPVWVGRQDDESLWGAIQVGLGLPLAVSLCGGISLFVLAAPVAQFVFHEPELVPLLRIAAFTIPCWTLLTSAVAVTRGLKLMHYKVIAQDIFLTLVKLILTLLLAVTGLNALKAMTAHSLSLAFACAMLVYLVNRLIPLSQPWGSGLRYIKQMLSFSLPLYLTQLLSLFGLNLRTMLVGALNTVTSVGIFAAATRVSIIGTAFVNSVGIMSMPIISELHSKKQHGQLGHFYQTMTKWTFTFNLPLFLSVLLFSRPILSIFGESFMAGSTALIILAAGDLVNAAAGMSSSIITMTGNSWLKAGNSIAMLVLSLALSVWLIPGWGAVGAATATTASVFIIEVVQVFEVFVLFRWLPYNRGFIKPVTAGLVSALATSAVARWIFTRADVASAFLCMSVLAAIYALSIVLMGLSEEDRLILKRLYYFLRRRVMPQENAR